MPIHRIFAASIGVAVATASGPLAAQSSQTQDLQADFSTPEGAILMLEDAYRRKDLDAAVAAKDFTAEARVMLSRLKREWSADAEVLKRTAEVLELAFRAEMKKRWPDFSGIKSRFPHKENYGGADDIVAVTEVCTFSRGWRIDAKAVGCEDAEWLASAERRPVNESRPRRQSQHARW